jgi:hypothetical protein
MGRDPWATILELVFFDDNFNDVAFTVCSSRSIVRI